MIFQVTSSYDFGNLVWENNPVHTKGKSFTKFQNNYCSNEMNTDTHYSLVVGIGT